MDGCETHLEHSYRILHSPMVLIEVSDSFSKRIHDMSRKRFHGMAWNGPIMFAMI